jgi:hypothetical protein
MYTIGIKRKFFFGYRKFVVNHHWTESVIQHKIPGDEAVSYHQIPARLCLELTEGSVVILPNIVATEWKVYPDFQRRNS